ncbi:MAG TPA: glycosyltransferase family 4 protein [Thermoanaerobaculia bacterium]|nr:glycosyltransferase family 4 protein [Thermoanaerobaculia bacterium]
MNIVYLEPAGKGGMIHYAFQMCRAMAAEGANVTLITERNYELAALPHPFRVETSIELWDPKPSGRQSSAPWAVAWRKLRRAGRAVRYYRQWLQLVRRVGQLDPDMVILGDVRFPFDLFPLMLLRRKARRFVDVCHNVHPYSTGGAAAGLFDRSRWRESFYRRIYRLFDRVFVHFERNRNEFLQSFGVPEERVDVIVHANEEIFRDLARPGFGAADLRARLGIPADQPVVLFFGTLSKYKGIDVLLQAFPAIHNATGARLVIAGFPSPDFDLGAHRSNDPSVTWVPEYIDSGEVAAWMELASVIVFPYRDIYQSGALHVAQVFGVPTVASAVGAMQDVIDDGVSGLLVKPEDVPALTEAIARLLLDRPFAEKLGARFAEDAQGPFSWKTVARKILAPPVPSPRARGEG